MVEYFVTTLLSPLGECTQRHTDTGRHKTVTVRGQRQKETDVPFLVLAQEVPKDRL